MAKKEEVSLAVLDTLKTREEYQMILESGAIPGNLDTVEKLMTVIQMGKELGMQPLTSVTNINIIKGRAVISSSILGALLKKSGVEYTYSKDFETQEDGRIITEIEFEFLSKISGKPKIAKFSTSWAEMELAGYTEKQNWEKYPKNMMRARTMAYAVRALFPEILLGVYTDSEIVDSMNTNHETILNEEGEIVIIDTTHEEVNDN